MTTTSTPMTHPPGLLDSAARVPHIALRLAAPELDEALACAQAEGRTAGNFARLVYLMGMDLYRAQGYLAMPQGATAPQRSRWQTRSGLVNDKPIALRLTADELQQAQDLAAVEERTPGNVARVLFHMGMAVYRQSRRLHLPHLPTAPAIAAAAN